MRDAPFNKRTAMALLAERGAKAATVSFSGGNDEGGVDDVILVFADDSTERVTSTYEGWGDRKVELTPEQQADNALVEALSAPVYEKYYSFAGEFYVSGAVEYDVLADTVKFAGEESNMVGESFSEEL